MSVLDGTGEGFHQIWLPEAILDKFLTIRHGDFPVPFAFTLYGHTDGKQSRGYSVEPIRVPGDKLLQTARIFAHMDRTTDDGPIISFSVKVFWYASALQNSGLVVMAMKKFYDKIRYFLRLSFFGSKYD